MARIRTIKPQFWSDAAIVSLPFEYRLLFQGIWNFADDEGFLENHPVQIKLNVFPADSVDIAKGVRALKSKELIEIVKLEGKSVIHVLGWKKHQRIDKPQPSQFAAAYANYQAQQAIPGTFPEHSQNVPAGREGKGVDRKGKDLSQVSGGGNPSSGDASTTTTDLPEPYRCAKHQGIDVKCYDCRDAKAAWKALEAERAKEAKSAARAASNADADRDKAERDATIPDDGSGYRKTIQAVQAARTKEEA